MNEDLEVIGMGDAQEIINASKRISEIEDIKNEFHNHIKKAQPPKAVLGSVSLRDDVLEAACLGHTLQAVPRVVIAPDNSFAVEYHFNATYQKETFTVWCFYLTSNGTLNTTVDNKADGRICDYNNDYATKKIIVRLSKALLLSRVFAPTVLTSV